jgi:hypothetical protein
MSVHYESDGPVGPTRMLLSKPVIAAVEGHTVATLQTGEMLGGLDDYGSGSWRADREA